MRKLNKSKEEFFSNSGWSSNLFSHTSKILLPLLEQDGFIIDYGRSVLYLKKNNFMIKAYVHYNHKSKEWLSFTDKKGIELSSFHYLTNVQTIYNWIKNFYKY